MLAGIVPNHPFFEPYPNGPYTHPRPHDLGYHDLERELAKPDRQENEPLFLISTDKNNYHSGPGGSKDFSVSPINEIANVLPRYGFDIVIVIDDKSANCDKVVNAIKPTEESELKVIPVWVRQGDHVSKTPNGMNIDDAKVKLNAVDAVSQVPQRVNELLGRNIQP